MKSVLKKPVVKFILTSTLLYIIWYALYELWIHPDQQVELIVTHNLAFLTAGVLKLLGYKLIEVSVLIANDRTVGIDGTHGLFIADSCSGLTLFALFSIFIIAFPGSIKRKLLYIPFGILTIHIINLLRIIGLCMVAYHAPEYLDFNHHYTFTISVYAWIFLLWVVWVNKYSKNHVM